MRSIFSRNALAEYWGMQQLMSVNYYCRIRCCVRVL